MLLEIRTTLYSYPRYPEVSVGEIHTCLYYDIFKLM